MNNQEFIDYCRNQLELSFKLISKGTKDPKQKHRAEGLLQAAKLLEILTQKDIETMMEDEHFKVFGESIAQRSERKLGLEELKAQNPDEYYEIPAIQRKPKSKNKSHI